MSMKYIKIAFIIIKWDELNISFSFSKVILFQFLLSLWILFDLSNFWKHKHKAVKKSVNFTLSSAETDSANIVKKWIENYLCSHTWWYLIIYKPVLWMSLMVIFFFPFFSNIISSQLKWGVQDVIFYWSQHIKESFQGAFFLIVKLKGWYI